LYASELWKFMGGRGDILYIYAVPEALEEKEPNMWFPCGSRLEIGLSKTHATCPRNKKGKYLLPIP
jgi:hypothetical protein